MLNDYNIKDGSSVIIACSGGPDSMALLDMVNNLHLYKIIVAHVNYHKRESALRDENIVKEYCLNNDILFFKKDYIENKKGNFQELAREFRYEFFKELYDRFEASCLLVAHHKDDLLETYLMKKKRKSYGKSLGILDDEINFNMRIIRPLLSFYKEDLVIYNHKNNVNYGIDESNLSKDYTRNKIRIETISNLDLDNKELLYKTYLNEEHIWKVTQDNLKKLIVSDSIKISDLKRLDDKEKEMILYIYFSKYNKIIERLNGDFVRSLLKQILSLKETVVIEISDDYKLVKDNSILKIYPNYKDFSFVINKGETFDFNGFKLDHNGKFGEGIYIEDSDYPLTIRSYIDSDNVEISIGHKSLSRFLLDKKIPRYIKKMYPVLLNSKNEILLIPDLYRNINRKNIQNTLYLIKYKDVI